MKNILADKKLLRSLLKQGDILNTINGGISSTFVKTEHTEKSIVIYFSTPGLGFESYKILLNNYKLTVFTTNSIIEGGDTGIPMAIPMFLKTFDIPETVNLNSIEALFEDGSLRIILPFKEKRENQQRFIDIKQIR